MKYTAYTAVLAAALMLSACASVDKKAETAKAAPNAPQKETIHIERTQEVAYMCVAGGKKQPMRVMYGSTGNDVLAAQVAFEGKMTPVLLRNAAKTDGNVFENGPVAWYAHAATAANVDKVNGSMLTFTGKQTVNGKETAATQVIAKNCTLDRRVTARLAKEAAAKAKAKAAGVSSGEAINAAP